MTTSTPYISFIEITQEHIKAARSLAIIKHIKKNPQVRIYKFYEVSIIEEISNSLLKAIFRIKSPIQELVFDFDKEYMSEIAINNFCQQLGRFVKKFKFSIGALSVGPTLPLMSLHHICEGIATNKQISVVVFPLLDYTHVNLAIVENMLKRTTSIQIIELGYTAHAILSMQDRINSMLRRNQELMVHSTPHHSLSSSPCITPYDILSHHDHIENKHEENEEKKRKESSDFESEDLIK